MGICKCESLLQHTTSNPAWAWLNLHNRTCRGSCLPPLSVVPFGYRFGMWLGQPPHNERDDNYRPSNTHQKGKPRALKDIARIRYIHFIKEVTKRWQEGQRPAC